MQQSIIHPRQIACNCLNSQFLCNLWWNVASLLRFASNGESGISWGAPANGKFGFTKPTIFFQQTRPVALSQVSKQLKQSHFQPPPPPTTTSTTKHHSAYTASRHEQLTLQRQKKMQQNKSEENATEQARRECNRTSQKRMQQNKLLAFLRTCFFVLSFFFFIRFVREERVAFFCFCFRAARALHNKTWTSFVFKVSVGGWLQCVTQVCAYTAVVVSHRPYCCRPPRAAS